MQRAATPTEVAVTFTFSSRMLSLLLVGWTLAAAPAAEPPRRQEMETAGGDRAAVRAPLRPGEAPAALATQAADFFRMARDRKWGEAAAMVSHYSRETFSIPENALPEAVLTHITFNPGRIFQLELTGKGWFHLAPFQEVDSEGVPPEADIYQMEILLQDADYYPEMTLLWIYENQHWRLLCDDIYRHYLSLDIPGDSRGLCTRFMRLLRHGRWEEAATMVSARAAQLPFSPPEPEPRDLIHSLTFVPGKNAFKNFVLTPDGDSWCEIGQYNEAQGWFEMRFHRLSGGEPRLSLVWVREADDWRVFCDADYLRYLDLTPPDRMPPALLEAVERFHTNFCRGFNRQWWDAWSDNSLWKAYDLGTEKLRARFPFSEFATFPDPLPVPRFNIKYLRIAGFAEREGGLVEVVVLLRGGGPGARLEAPATSQWIEIEGNWWRTTADVEFAGE